MVVVEEPGDAVVAKVKAIWVIGSATAMIVSRPA